MNRFDYVKFDDESQKLQAEFKKKFIELADMIYNRLDLSRPQNIALTKLEEAYAWVGKGIRDRQLVRNSDTEIEGERGNE